MKTIDIYLEDLKGDSVAWMEIKEAEGLVTVEVKGTDPKPAKMGIVNIIKIFMDGIEVFKFNVGKKAFCKALRCDFTDDDH